MPKHWSRMTVDEKIEELREDKASRAAVQSIAGMVDDISVVVKRLMDDVAALKKPAARKTR